MNCTAAPRKILNDLDDKERKLLESLLGPESYHFTPNNPTGHYRLDVSKHDEREVREKGGGEDDVATGGP